MALHKEILKIDKDGNIVARYQSSSEAARENGTTKYTMSKLILGKRKDQTINGYYFKHTGNYTNAIDKIGTGEFKCPYCERKFKTYKSLCFHVIRFKAHGEISSEKLLTDFKYGGVRPTCACGCGGYTSIDRSDGLSFREYIVGHSTRVHNNWGHNPKAIEHSAETRRRQFKEGTRKTWIEGKKWTEVFTPEQIEDLKKRIFSKERNEKLSKTLKGVPKSEATKQRLREIFNREEYKNRRRDVMLERINNQKFSVSSKAELEFIDKFIKPLGFDYKTQYYIPEIHQYCDVYIPDKNTIVEYDGDFWHSNPAIFKNGPIFEYQKKHFLRDEKENEYCKIHGINIIRIWESDVKGNPDKVRKRLMDI